MAHCQNSPEARAWCILACDWRFWIPSAIFSKARLSEPGLRDRDSLTCTLSQKFCGDEEELILHQPRDLNLSAKGLRDCNSPTCTLSQNGYGDKEVVAYYQQSLCV